jgi:hypothetical protein
MVRLIMLKIIRKYRLRRLGLIIIIATYCLNPNFWQEIINTKMVFITKEK